MSSGKSQSGFTLLEILVVMVIIALMAAIAILSAGGDDRDDKMKLEARRLAELIRLASEQAVMRGKEVGLEVSADGYRFAVLQNRKWLPIEDEQSFHPRHLPEPLELNIALDTETKTLFGRSLTRNPADDKGPRGTRGRGGKDDERAVDNTGDDGEPGDKSGQAGKSGAGLVNPAGSVKPQVFILSSGEVSPFAIALGVDGDDRPEYWRIMARDDGQIRLDGPHEGSLHLDLKYDAQAISAAENADDGGEGDEDAQ